MDSINCFFFSGLKIMIELDHFILILYFQWPIPISNLIVPLTISHYLILLLLLDFILNSLNFNS